MRRVFTPALAVVVAGLALGTYFLGMYTGVKQLWPVPQLKSLMHRHDETGGIVTNRFGRLVAYPGKQKIACPAQTPDTAVLLVAGQSNSGNHQGQRYKAIDSRVIEFFDGQCYLAQSPLLGSSGEIGESSTLLGNKLVEAGLYKQVVIIPAAMGASAIRQWAAGGDLNGLLMSVIENAKPTYTITHVLWHQGESDFLDDTPEDSYIKDFHSLVDSIRREGVSAPIYVSVASFMGYVKPWNADNSVRMAQQALPDGKSILAGPDSDTIPLSDRYDGIHFSASGQEKFTNLWLKILSDSQNKGS